MGGTHEAYSIDVYVDGGYSRSSDEVFVMNMERRAVAIQVSSI